ncbi:MAG: hypothetical protein IJY36_06835 [Coprobacter sp.]|nr:hypothetical protein [Coprobacter sp.]
MQADTLFTDNGFQVVGPPMGGGQWHDFIYTHAQLLSGLNIFTLIALYALVVAVCYLVIKSSQRIWIKVLNVMVVNYLPILSVIYLLYFAIVKWTKKR